MTTNPTCAENHPDGEARPLKPDAPAPLDSAELFKSRNEMVISHEGEHYRLRRTRNGKLILTK